MIGPAEAEAAGVLVQTMVAEACTRPLAVNAASRAKCHLSPAGASRCIVIIVLAAGEARIEDRAGEILAAAGNLAGYQCIKQFAINAENLAKSRLLPPVASRSIAVIVLAVKKIKDEAKAVGGIIKAKSFKKH